MEKQTSIYRTVAAYVQYLYNSKYNYGGFIYAKSASVNKSGNTFFTLTVRAKDGGIPPSVYIF